MKQIPFVTILVLCVFQITILGQIPFPLGYSNGNSYLPAGLNPIQILPNPYFESTPEFTVNGSSGELSAQMADSGNIFGNFDTGCPVL